MNKATWPRDHPHCPASPACITNQWMPKSHGQYPGAAGRIDNSCCLCVAALLQQLVTLEFSLVFIQGDIPYHPHCRGSCLRQRNSKHGTSIESRGRKRMRSHQAIQDAVIQGLRMARVVQGLQGGLPRVCLGGPLRSGQMGCFTGCQRLGGCPCPPFLVLIRCCPHHEVQLELQACTNMTTV